MQQQNAQPNNVRSQEQTIPVRVILQWTPWILTALTILTLVWTISTWLSSVRMIQVEHGKAIDANSKSLNVQSQNFNALQTQLYSIQTQLAQLQQSVSDIKSNAPAKP